MSQHWDRLEGKKFLVGRDEVRDSDTITIISNDELEDFVAELLGVNYQFPGVGRTRTLRFFGIDSMELDQPMGLDGHNRTQQLLLPYEQIGIDVKDVDRYGRIVAEITAPEDNFDSDCAINKMLVREGYAVAYQYWLRKAGGTYYQRYMADQDFARENKYNFWNLPDEQRIYPMVWRKNKREREENTRWKTGQ